MINIVEKTNTKQEMEEKNLTHWQAIKLFQVGFVVYTEFLIR